MAKASAATTLKKVDRVIEAMYQKLAEGRQINIFDISKVFAEGRKAYLEIGPAGLEPAIKAAVEKYTVREMLPRRADGRCAKCGASGFTYPAHAGEVRGYGCMECGTVKPEA